MYLCRTLSMIRFKHSLLLSGMLLLVLSACKNDLKLSAPYKEIPMIYAILNPSEPEQVIRINKVFLGEGDATQMAKVSDSVNYQPGEITVTLGRELGGQMVDEVRLEEAEIETAQGAFASRQRVYKIATDSLFRGSVTDLSGRIYRLSVRNNRTGNVFTATTTAISPLTSAGQLSNLFHPPFHPFPAGTDPATYIDYSDQNLRTYSVRFYTNEADIYKVTLRLHFYDSLYDHSRVYRAVDYDAGTIEKKGRHEILTTFKGANIYQAAGLGLSKMSLSNDLYGRKMEYIEYIINSTTQDYIDFMQYNSPSLSLNQNKPLYSNFENQAALGIFTFRTSFSVTKSLSSTYISSFSENTNSCRYKFYTSSFQLRGCR
jgi:hypothetical protein